MTIRIIRSYCQYIWLGQAGTDLCTMIYCVHICLLDFLNQASIIMVVVGEQYISFMFVWYITVAGNQ